MQILCPTCKKPMEWSLQNQYRPFCSERCKLIDLGAWSDGSYAIPGEQPVDPDLLPPDHTSEDESD